MVLQLWFVYALSAAVLWGFSYALVEKVLNHGVAPSFMLLCGAIITLPIYLLLANGLDSIKSGIDIIWSDKTVLMLVLLIEIATVIGSFLILCSINEKNATLVSLVEIAYPLFTFLFCWLLLKEVQLTWNTAFGGLLIFSGIFVIYLKS